MFNIQQKKSRTYIFGAVLGLAALAGIAGCKKNSPRADRTGDERLRP